jgi:hypothetical protein
MMEPKEGQASEVMQIAATDTPTPLPVTDDQERIRERWVAIQSAFREVRRLSQAHQGGAATTEVLG